MCIACAADTANPDPGILDVLYDYAAAGNAIRAAMKDVRTGSGESGRGVFKWLPLLPLEKPPSNTLQAGDTPLISAPRLAARLGLATLYIKDETRNPTRCLKDRATAVGMAMAMAQGRKEVFCASAGNAAISLAGFAAHAGIPCHVFVPSYASATRLDWLRRYGADVHVSKGNYDDAFAESETKGRAHGWWSRNCALNPFLVEGKKTCALEIGEQLKWIPPDFVVAPVGDGCTLGAIGKGFRELQLLELTKGLPRLIGIQAEAVQPLVRRHSGAAARDDSGSTQASSIAVRRPRNALRLLRELKESSGTMLAVSDAETAEAQRIEQHLWNSLALNYSTRLRFRSSSRFTRPNGGRAGGRSKMCA
ncbi:MAG: pyridoxal-phosphate dependent enzyme [Acidobacteria bacterium]|nr:pyridoxal-phosphate dependent enzyme [Acidobacteriota bacterium]